MQNTMLEIPWLLAAGHRALSPSAIMVSWILDAALLIVPPIA
jgi:hypothetical protein